LNPVAKVSNSLDVLIHGGRDPETLNDTTHFTSMFPTPVGGRDTSSPPGGGFRGAADCNPSLPGRLFVFHHESTPAGAHAVVCLSSFFLRRCPFQSGV